MTRGYRNNNPGNIILTPGKFWLGEKKDSTDNRFKQFISMEYGYRAVFVLLQSYITNGNDTIEKIINKYAPATENPTNTYIKNVVAWTGIKKDKVISANDENSLKKIVTAISKVENGVVPEQSLINKGWELIKKKS